MDTYDTYNRTRVTNLIADALLTDGEHHKQWYLEQIAKELAIDMSIEDYKPGIAP